MRTTPGGNEVEAREVAARAAAAAAIRRLGHAITGHMISAELAIRVAELATELAALAEDNPKRNKENEHASSPRFATLVAGGIPDPVPDGEVIEFDRFSVVGGPLNPFAIGAHHRRDGDDAVTTVNFGPAFEGPPGRVHGGAIALVMDEATATVLPMTGRFGFTGSVSLKLLAPAPLGVDLEFRSVVVGEERRKLFIRCLASGPEGVFAEADAIYIQSDPAVIPWVIAARAAAALKAR